MTGSESRGGENSTEKVLWPTDMSGGSRPDFEAFRAHQEKLQMCLQEGDCFPDPLYVPKAPRKSGVLPVGEGVGLYYEVRGESSAERKLVLVVGAFSTMWWSSQLADYFATKGFEVLSFDNRGIGRSREASPQMPKADHTYVAEVLAADVWSLVDHVWGPEQQVHLYGQSMGGMIIQKAALLDLERVESSKAPCRVQSLFLSVTSRGIYRTDVGVRLARWFVPLELKTGLLHFLTPIFIVPRVSTAWHGLRKQAVVEHLTTGCFSDPYLATRHPRDGRTMKELWHEHWAGNYEQLNSFHDHDACVKHCALLGMHRLCHDEADRLVASKVPVCVHVAQLDRIVPPSKQYELVTCLKAQTVIETKGGHHSDTADHGRSFLPQILDFYRQVASQ